MFHKLYSRASALILIFVLLMLAGCASKAPKPTSQPSQLPEKQASPEELWQWHSMRLKNLRNWQMEGRIAATKGQEGGNASFVWKQMGESYQIKFFGPFGAGSVLVSGSPYSVSLKEADGKTHYAQTAEELMSKVAGWQVPISGIRYWMLGIPMPQSNVQNQSLNERGHLASLQQLGWSIRYNDYHENRTPSIPSKLKMENGALKVKIIIKNLKTHSVT